MDGLNEQWIAGVAAERGPYQMNRLHQVVLDHGDARPRRLNQLLLADHFRRPPDQFDEDGERTLGKIDPLAVSSETASMGVR